MTCKIAYTEKLLTKISRKKKGQMERSDEKKKLLNKLCLRGYKKKVTKPIIYSRKKQNPCYKML